MNKELGQKFFNLEFNSPIVLLSGCVGFGDEYTRVEGFSNEDVGAICLKGTTLKERIGNNPQRIYETESGMINAIGLQNPGADFVIKEILPSLDMSKTNFIANISGSTVDEYVQVVKKFDNSDHARIEEFIEDVTLELGGLDILINNAGTNVDNLSLRMKYDEWKKVIDVNLTSTFLLSKYSIKKMLKSKYGRVVNIASVVGHTGNIGQPNYAASKAGIIGMSKSLAIEYAKKNITINCVSPGFIDTDMTTNIAEKVKLFLTSRIPMGRLGSGEDVSNCVAFLSSDQAAYVTGETIHVNGGMYMS